ncbi:trypsin-like serine peptidase [Sandaracinus amylolyticus]|uniref:trypsin-like serine peptidase n=1 Tax=Sandaracinus amylolyticus TaxID=927083 RepID=UPI001F451B36|nr:trypsin-like serine protease [Sandaracinus amylolyticus]UJR82927.1 Hypothetical protein I5071_49920 [Sandaracinus amylolyticus]
MTRTFSNHPSVWLSVSILAASIGGCEAPRSGDLPPSTFDDAGDGGVGVVTEELRDGDFSFEDPAVGRLVVNGSGCTATLIDPIAVVTAAHCVDYRTGSISGTFTIHLSATNRQSFNVTSTRSYGSGVGDDDVAVVRLARAVPSSVATPFGVHPGAIVSNNERVVMYGFGCRAEEGDFAAGRKQRLWTRYDHDDVISCPGDSGGPVIKTMASGARVVSKVFSGRRRRLLRTEQLYGLVYEYADRIDDQVDDWAGRPRSDHGGGGGGGGGGGSGGGGSNGHPPQDQF